MSDKSADTIVDREWQLACLALSLNLSSLDSKQTVVWESLDCLTDFTPRWSLGSFF